MALVLAPRLTQTVFLVHRFGESRAQRARDRRRGESGQSEERRPLLVLWKDGRCSGRALVRVSCVFVLCPRQPYYVGGEWV